MINDNAVISLTITTQLMMDMSLTNGNISSVTQWQMNYVTAISLLINLLIPLFLQQKLCNLLSQAVMRSLHIILSSNIGKEYTTVSSLFLLSR